MYERIGNATGTNMPSPALERVLSELAYVSAERDRLQLACDIMQEENRKLRTELAHAHRPTYPCQVCGTSHHTVRDADACEVKCRERRQ